MGTAESEEEDEGIGGRRRCCRSVPALVVSAVEAGKGGAYTSFKHNTAYMLLSLVMVKLCRDKQHFSGSAFAGSSVW